MDWRRVSFSNFSCSSFTPLASTIATYITISPIFQHSTAGETLHGVVVAGKEEARPRQPVRGDGRRHRPPPKRHQTLLLVVHPRGIRRLYGRRLDRRFHHFQRSVFRDSRGRGRSHDERPGPTSALMRLETVNGGPDQWDNHIAAGVETDHGMRRHFHGRTENSNQIWNKKISKFFKVFQKLF